MESYDRCKCVAYELTSRHHFLGGTCHVFVRGGGQFLILQKRKGKKEEKEGKGRALDLLLLK